MKKVVEYNYIDLWVLNHFKILPTDRRYLELSDAAKYLLFQAFLRIPPDDILYAANAESQRRAQIDDQTAEQLKNIGYTDDQIKFMQAQLKLAGV